MVGDSYTHQRSIKISQKMQNIIDKHPHFSAKPIGPLYQHLSDNFRCMLPSSFLHCYVVASYEDSEVLAKLCQKYKEAVPDRIIREYGTELYEDIMNDSTAESYVIKLLREENPVVANLLIDYFEIHKQSKYIAACCTIL